MPCCGRPNNRANKDSAKDYYARYAYLNHHQKEKQLAAVGTKCATCDALTVGDPCSVCNNPKPSQETTS